MDIENKYGTLKVQQRLLQLLKTFDALCKKNNIVYSVSSGTMLGAIRHQGFIPWDDDVDITIERKYYNRLMAVVHESPTLVSDKDLWLDRIWLMEDYEVFHGDRHACPTIDVFTWDYVPDNKLKERIKYYAIAFLQGTIKPRPDYTRFSWSGKVLSFVTYMAGRFFPLSVKLRLYDRLALWGNGKPTRFQAGYHDQFNALRFRYPFHMLEKVERHRFEDTEVNVMSSYDEYLKIIYGENYMTPPQESDQRPTHIKQ